MVMSISCLPDLEGFWKLSSAVSAEGHWGETGRPAIAAILAATGPAWKKIWSLGLKLVLSEYPLVSGHPQMPAWPLGGPWC